jgi:hypothetical protein
MHARLLKSYSISVRVEKSTTKLMHGLYSSYFLQPFAALKISQLFYHIVTYS